MHNYFSSNLVKLRKDKGLNQLKAATELQLNRSTYANYETGFTEPSIEIMQRIVQLFGITMDELINVDLSKGNLIANTGTPEKGNPKGNGNGNLMGKNDPLKGGKSSLKLEEPGVNYGVKYGVSTPNIITVDSGGSENIVYVPVAARAGYLLGFGDPKYIAKLDSFTLPGLRNGTYRMFEVEGQSMAPTILQGDRLICKWVENFDNIRENRIHIVVTRDGIVAKRVLNRIYQRGKIVLKSDTITHRKDYITYEINPDDVLEIWYAIFKISGDLSEPAEIYTRVADLEAEMVEIRSISKSFTDEIQAIKKRLPKAR